MWSIICEATLSPEKWLRGQRVSKFGRGDQMTASTKNDQILGSKSDLSWDAEVAAAR